MGGVKITLVERIRDLEQGQNTLMTLDELLPLGLDILVFKDNVPTNPNRRSYLDEEGNPSLNMDGYTLIDTKWISIQTLGPNADDGPLKNAYDEARNRYFGFSLQAPDPENRKESRLHYQEWERRLSEYNQREAEYRLFRPSALTELIKSKDLVVVPRSLSDKVKAEIPEARVAVLEDVRLGEFQLRAPATQENNYPRILMRTTERDISSDQRRIDSKTIRLLFNQEDREDDEGLSLRYIMSDPLRSLRYHRTIDQLFYEVFDSNAPTFTNPVERSTTLTHHPRRIMRSRKGIRFADESNVVVTLNNYGMGKKIRGIDFLKRLREDKVEKVQELYRGLWTQPLDSIPDILDRQTLIGELVENLQHFETVRGLETAVNAIYEPYIHLSNMSKLISANILRSRWSGAIERNSFYHDFMEIARTFVEGYEQMSHSLGNIKTDSREMQVLLEPLRALVEDNSPFDQTYRFIRNTLDSAPVDFESLRTIFQQELERKGATKLEELEKYNPNKDSWLREKVGRDKISAVGSRKSPYLIGLLEKFHSQNPVTNSEPGTSYIDYVGSKLAAYTAMAEFIRNNGWTRPEILPGEEGIVDIRNGWYPLTRLQQSADFVGNDTLLNPDYHVEIIDGVNAGGKTIDVKKAVFITALALAGTYVPAEHAGISFFNRVRFRIKQTGMYETSALRGEVSELESALKALGTPILLGLDETFTSTNSLEGEAMTYGLVKRLAQDGIARAIITSHYPTLQEIADDPQVLGVKFSHFDFQRDGSRLMFSYKKLEGPNTGGDYAIAIAENEQLHPGILRHAKQYAGRSK